MSSESGSSSKDNNRSGNGNRKNNSRRRNSGGRKRRSNNQGNGGANNSGPNKNQNKKGGNNNKRRRNNNNRRGPKLTGFEKVERGYLNLLEKHLEARKKYYDLFHRADPRQLAKLERNFYRTLDELRDYEDGVKPEYKEEFDQKYNGLKLDTTYSENHDLPVESEPVPVEGDFDDPHYLPTQKDHEFKGDEEESVGSIEDYYRYKGVEPPAPQESEEKK